MVVNASRTLSFLYIQIPSVRPRLARTLTLAAAGRNHKQRLFECLLEKPRVFLLLNDGGNPTAADGHRFHRNISGASRRLRGDPRTCSMREKRADSDAARHHFELCELSKHQIQVV